MNNQNKLAAAAIDGALNEIVDDKLLIARTIDHVSVAAAIAFIAKASDDGMEFGERALTDLSRMAAELVAKYVNAMVGKFGLEFAAKACPVLERDAPAQLADMMYAPPVQARIKSMAMERRAKADEIHARTMVRDESVSNDIRSTIQAEQIAQAKADEAAILRNLDNELRAIDAEAASKSGRRQYPQKKAR